MENKYTLTDSEKLLRRLERTKLAQKTRVEQAKAHQVKGAQDLIKQALAALK